MILLTYTTCKRKCKINNSPLEVLLPLHLRQPRRGPAEREHLVWHVLSSSRPRIENLHRPGVGHAHQLHPPLVQHVHQGYQPPDLRCGMEDVGVSNKVQRGGVKEEGGMSLGVTRSNRTWAIIFCLACTKDGPCSSTVLIVSTNGVVASSTVLYC